MNAPNVNIAFPRSGKKCVFGGKNVPGVKGRRGTVF